MKTYKVQLSIGLLAFVEAQRWADEGREIAFRIEDSIIASYTRNLVLRTAVGDAVEYERASDENL